MSFVARSHLSTICIFRSVCQGLANAWKGQPHFITGRAGEINRHMLKRARCIPYRSKVPQRRTSLSQGRAVCQHTACVSRIFLRSPDHRRWNRVADVDVIIDTQFHPRSKISTSDGPTFSPLSLLLFNTNINTTALDNENFAGSRSNEQRSSNFAPRSFCGWDVLNLDCWKKARGGIKQYDSEKGVLLRFVLFVFPLDAGAAWTCNSDGIWKFATGENEVEFDVCAVFTLDRETIAAKVTYRAAKIS